jgi:dihydropteroate synthase
MRAAPEDVFGSAALRFRVRTVHAAPRKAGGVVRLRFASLTAAERGTLGELASPLDDHRFHLLEDSIPGIDGDDPLTRAIRAALENARERKAESAPPRFMGIVNVTPDSFSDGGKWHDPGRAVEHALKLADEGAAYLDIGGESTRPGSQPVPSDEESRRVIPVIESLARQTRARISVDTTKADVAERALDAGATMVNDISAGRFDERMIPLVRARGCDYVLMHMQGTPRDMQVEPKYDDVVDDVFEFLRERAAACWRAELAPERMLVDPGIGFGKTLEHNLELLRNLRELSSLGLRVVVGPSRKAFIQRINERFGGPSKSEPEERVGGTAAAVAACVRGGASILRVHDVRVMAEAARVAWALERARDGEVE